VILALDSSSSQGSAALVQDGQTKREILVDTPRGRGGALFRALEEILRDQPGLERVVVGTGPGSYNGIRAALAGGWGIALARGIPLVGVCSLLGLAEGSYCAVGDARRGQYYFAEVTDGILLAGPFLVSPEALPSLIAARRVFVPAPVDFLPEAEIASPSASRLARLGAFAPATGRVPEPLYLKDPFITAPRIGG
jgi:tRNA threonylcarbamoyladenosine biosynthesis protein TsaB